MANRKPTGFDSAVVTSSGRFASLHIAQHTTIHIMKENLKKMLNEMFFNFLTYVTVHVFTANPKEITVNNFASTFDNADHSS